MTNEDRLRSGQYQLTIYSANQYLLWRIAMIKSIKHILENADDFYKELKCELRQSDDETGDKTVHHEIKNGLMFEALAQSMQSIEDLFSLMKNASDISYFVKYVIVYHAGAVNQYIRDFDTENLEYLLNQMKLLYFPLDEPWENTEIFEIYKGMAFDSFNFEKRAKRSDALPVFAIPHFHPDIAGNVRELHDEDNLLRSDLKVVHIDSLISIAEKAYTLINVFWGNLRKRCTMTDEDKFMEQYFPISDYRKVAEIGFPKADI